MGLSTFIGGVHPYEGKELSAVLKQVFSLPYLIPHFYYVPISSGQIKLRGSRG